jgi:hypothetical protein
MNDRRLQQKNHLAANNQAELDISAMAEQIWQKFQGRVSHAAIRQILLDILPMYENARVRRYVPILVRRKALEMLRWELAEGSASDEAKVEPRPNDRVEQPASGLKTGIVLPGRG